jgi:DNA-directed RNA polymerase specialized sigma24 family protein
MSDPASRTPEAEGPLLARWLHDRDPEAAAGLWRLHRPLAVAIAARGLAGLTDEQQEAEELADELFLRCLAAFDPEQAAEVGQPLRAYYLRAVRNAVIDRRRRLSREGGAPVPAQAAGPGPDPQLHAQARQVADQLQAFVEACFLPSDLELVRAWMEARAAGEPVPWAEVAARVPVTVPGELRYPTGQATPPPDAPLLHLTARTLDALPTVQLVILGEAGPDELAMLATARADAGRAAVERLSQRRTTGPHPRLRTAAAAQRTRARLRVEVESGGQRSADAVRMRVEKVILPRFVAQLRGSADV